VLGALGLAACGQDEAQGVQGAGQSLLAECVAADATLPEGAWTCPNTLKLECSDGSGTVDPESIYLREGEQSCGGATLTATSGPFGVGEHTIVVRDESGAERCRSTLEVTDSVAPVLTPKVLNLWPPNHKFHAIKVEDCVSVTDACRADLRAEFIWASSDEPVDSLGDGHHAPDILLDTDCHVVQLRAERQGPKDGRVYKLGVRVVDDGGRASEAVCTVVVDHDQRGVLGADSGESYRVTFDGQNGGLACDGENPPVAPPVVEPPVEEPPPSSGEPDAGTEEPGPIVE
jgi:hypothetical protein